MADHTDESSINFHLHTSQVDIFSGDTLSTAPKTASNFSSEALGETARSFIDLNAHQR